MIRIVLPFYNEFSAAKPGLRAMLDEKIVPFQFFPVQGVGVDENRNLGVNEGRSYGVRQTPVAGYTHFLFIDSDVAFRPEHVRRLLWHDQAIAALPYHRRNGNEYQAGTFDGEGKPDCYYTDAERGYKAVDFVGGGFILIRRDVFPRLRYPWFRREVLTVRDEAWQDSGDYGFCRNARASGYEIYCDFDYPVLHSARTAADFDVGF